MAIDFPRPRVRLLGDLRVPAIAPNKPLIGIAFDYLLRFHLQQRYDFAITAPWIAEKAHRTVSQYGDTGMLLLVGNEYLFSGAVRDRMARQICEAKRLVAKFVTGGPLTDDLIRATINLAHCDPFYRAGRIDERFGRPMAAQVDELRNLIEIVDWSLLKAQRLCLLNPAFGEGSAIVGGADADLLLDDTLIDIKTTSNLQLRADDWRQLLGYAALNAHFPIGSGSDPVTIRNIGIYFARHGLLTTWPIDQLVGFEKFKAFTVWLRDYVLRAHAGRLASRRALEESVVKQRMEQRARLRRAKRGVARRKHRAPPATAKSKRRPTKGKQLRGRARKT
jgi:hypothetical protein